MKPIQTFVAGTGLLLGTAVATLSASATLAEENKKLISSADVVVELEDVEANALDYWPNVEADLEEMLSAKIAPYYSGDGHEITVRLSEISIDGSALLGNEGEFNTLNGWIYIREKGNPDPVESIGLSLTAKTGNATPATEDTIVIPPGRNAFYQALLDRFAERTLEEVQSL
ncbi:MAG: hypothetical protein RIE24_25365 [Silicimonas sp.]